MENDQENGKEQNPWGKERSLSYPGAESWCDQSSAAQGETAKMKLKRWTGTIFQDLVVMV
jgi:hypothetical protein